MICFSECGAVSCVGIYFLLIHHRTHIGCNLLAVIEYTQNIYQALLGPVHSMWPVQYKNGIIFSDVQSSSPYFLDAEPIERVKESSSWVWLLRRKGWIYIKCVLSAAAKAVMSEVFHNHHILSDEFPIRKPVLQYIHITYL